MARALVGQVARVIGVIGATAAVTWFATRPDPLAPPPRTALSIELPTDHAFVDSAISQDGSTLVYTAIAAGRAQLFSRRLDRFKATPLEGTEHASQPFFAPDGERVAFFADGWLKWTSLSGGEPVNVAPVAGAVAGGTWGPGDEIVYAPLGGRGLQLVRLGDVGGTSTLTNVDVEEISHGWPHFLPDGRSLLFTLARQNRDPQIAWLSRESSDYSLLGPVEGAVFYIGSGRIVFARLGEIFAMPVDFSERSATGPTLPVIGSVAGAGVGYDRLGRSSLIASREGRLLYADVADGSAKNVLVWVDRHGTATEVDGVVARHQSPRVSPDGFRITVAIHADIFRRDLWLLHTGTGERSALTDETGDNHSPIWSTDGRITFASNRDGPQRIYRTTTDIPVVVETLVFGDGRTPGSWSPDGTRLFFHEAYPARGRDIWVWGLGSTGAESSLISGTSANERAPTMSPAGRHLAYVSDAADGDQVYVRVDPEQQGVRVSTAGGTEPVWDPDGSTLYFRNGRDLLAVAVDADTGTFGAPVRLFSGSFVRDPGGNVASYDTSPDGTRFLMLRPEKRTTALRVISNWESTQTP